MRTNYHTHTPRCRHASGIVADYCRAAVDNELAILGFSDHCPHPDDKWVAVRMGHEEIDDYCREIKEVSAGFPQLEIHCGLECEYRPELGNYQLDEFLNTPGRCEYLILGQHSYISCEGDWHSAWNVRSPKALHELTDFVIKALSTGIYSMLAHPDVMFYTGYGWNEETLACSRALADAAVACDIPLELNCNGIRKPKVLDWDGVMRHPYPYLNFWAVAAEQGAKVIIGSDAHEPEHVWCRDNITAEGIANYFDLEIVNVLKMFRNR